MAARASAAKPGAGPASTVSSIRLNNCSGVRHSQSRRTSCSGSLSGRLKPRSHGRNPRAHGEDLVTHRILGEDLDAMAPRHQPARNAQFGRDGATAVD